MRIVVVACCLLVGCGSTARDRALDEFVEQLVDDGGIGRDAAQCIVDRFFDGMSTADVEAFFERDVLTAEESVRFAESAEVCRPAVLDEDEPRLPARRGGLLVSRPFRWRAVGSCQ